MQAHESPTCLPTPQALAPLPRAERNARLLDALRGGEFDFVDFGTHKGGGLALGLELGGTRGLGIEINESKCQALLAKGLYVVSEDAFLLPPIANTVRFAVFSHVLEHLPDEATACIVLKRVSEFCRDFIFIQQPDFSAETYLWRHGLQFAHTNMKGHLWRPSTRRLVEVLWNLGFHRFAVGGQSLVADSTDPWLHSAEVQSNALWKHEPETDPPKPAVTFNPPLYRDVAIAVAKSTDVDPQALLRKVRVRHIHLESFSVVQ